MTEEPEMIQLESDHGGKEVKVKEKSCTSLKPVDVYPSRSPIIKSKRKRKLVDKNEKEKQMKKSKKEPEEGTIHVS